MGARSLVQISDYSLLQPSEFGKIATVAMVVCLLKKEFQDNTDTIKLLK